MNTHYFTKETPADLQFVRGFIKKGANMKRTLIVVDMQKGFMTKPNYLKLQSKVNKLINLNDYNNYIFTKFINKDQSLYEKKLNWFGLKSEESQTICVDIPQNSLILEKYGYGLSIEQINQLKALNVEQIDICGLQTDACVYAIAFQLFDNGIFPNILINYCQTSPQRNSIAKEILIHQFGKVDEKL